MNLSRRFIAADRVVHLQMCSIFRSEGRPDWLACFCNPQPCACWWLQFFCAVNIGILTLSVVALVVRYLSHF